MSVNDIRHANRPAFLRWLIYNSQLTCERGNQLHYNAKRLTVLRKLFFEPLPKNLRGVKPPEHPDAETYYQNEPLGLEYLDDHYDLVTLLQMAGVAARRTSSCRILSPTEFDMLLLEMSEYDGDREGTMVGISVTNNIQAYLALEMHLPVTLRKLESHPRDLVECSRCREVLNFLKRRLPSDVVNLVLRFAVEEVCGLTNALTDTHNCSIRMEMPHYCIGKPHSHDAAPHNVDRIIHHVGLARMCWCTILTVVFRMVRDIEGLIPFGMFNKIVQYSRLKNANFRDIEYVYQVWDLAKNSRYAYESQHFAATFVHAILGICTHEGDGAVSNPSNLESLAVELESIIRAFQKKILPDKIQRLLTQALHPMECDKYCNKSLCTYQFVGPYSSPLPNQWGAYNSRSASGQMFWQ